MVRSLAQGIERQGHDVTVVDSRTESGKSLTPYAYIAVGTVSPSLFAKTIPNPVVEFLRSSGHISGKRCYAFILNKGLRKGRVLSSLMKVMESEGMYLKKSDILANAAEAEAVGSKLHIEKTVI
ncbi:MAG: hypothetical protein KAH21_12220 [Spirochaetaceae bacterium]|nr:hypothetical protein [Spirochaetaceae bacterium]